MKIKRITIVLLGLFAAGITTTSISRNTSLDQFKPKIARASSLSVNCNCALLGGNKNCAANNYGATCTDSQYCYLYHGNCEG